MATLNVPRFPVAHSHCLHDICYVDVVPGWFAIPVHLRPLAAPQRVAEYCDDTGLTVRALARPVDVSQPQNRVPQARAVGPGIDIGLGAHLDAPYGANGEGMNVSGVGIGASSP